MRITSRAWRLVAAIGAAVVVTGIGAGFGVGAADAAVATTKAGITAGTAAATGATIEENLSAGFSTVVLAPGGLGQTVDLTINGYASAATTIKGVTVQIDVSGLAGVATVVPQGSTCSTSGTLITCTAPNLKVAAYAGPNTGETPYSGAEVLPFTLAAPADAVAGASADVSISASGTGATNVGYSQSTINVADGPNIGINAATLPLGVGGSPAASVKAGSTYNRSLSFTNYGDQAAQGVTIEVNSFGEGVDVPETRKGCEYEAPDVAYCYIPDLVAPGATETLSPALQLLTGTDLMWQGVNIQVVPGYASLPTYTVGTGKAFSLVDSTGAAQVPVTGQATQTNIGQLDLWQFQLRVTSASADYAAQASLFNYPGNDEYDVQPDITNNGTGFIYLGESADFQLTEDVVVPSGVDVLSVPSDWVPVVGGTPAPIDAGKPGYSEYEFNAGIDLAAGAQSYDYNPGQFVIQAQPGFAGGSGTVTAGIDFGPATPYLGMFGNIDSDPSNDSTTFDIPAY